MDERKSTGASYLINFYQEVSRLTQAYSNYINILTELGTKSEHLDQMSEHEKNTFIEVVQEVRFSVNVTYISYCSIKRGLRQQTLTENDIDVEALHNAINEKFAIHKEKLKEYVVEINSFLITDIVQELLNTSQNIVEGMYS